VVVIAVLIKKKKIDPLEIDLQKPVFAGRFFACVMAFAAYTLLTEFVLYKMELLQVDAWKKSLLPSIIQIVGIVILAPIAEELLFRGLVLSKLIKAGVNKHLAILIISALFVALHNFSYQNTMPSNIGIVLGFVDVQHTFHIGHKKTILQRRNYPTFYFPGLKFVFFRTRLTVS